MEGKRRCEGKKRRRKRGKGAKAGQFIAKCSAPGSRLPGQNEKSPRIISVLSIRHYPENVYTNYKWRGRREIQITKLIKELDQL